MQTSTNDRNVNFSQTKFLFCAVKPIKVVVQFNISFGALYLLCDNLYDWILLFQARSHWDYRKSSGSNPKAVKSIRVSFTPGNITGAGIYIQPSVA